MEDGNKKLGTFLKTRRESRGKNIDEIAEALKITPINITNIENGNFESIGLGQTFVNFYIKSYIMELGESPDYIFNKFYGLKKDEANKIEKELNNASTIFYSPIVLFVTVVIFLFISYAFVSYAIKRDVNGINESSGNVKVELKKDTKDNTSEFSNYSETTR